MNDEQWYRSPSAIAFYSCIALVLLVVVIAQAVHAQEATNGAESSSGGGFWDTLGQWWNSFTEWLAGGNSGEIPFDQKPSTIEPLVVGWSNKNHTVMIDEPSLCETPSKECNNDNCTHLEPCMVKQPFDVIDDAWQTASTTGVSKDLSRDYYWFVKDAKVIGDNKRLCDGGIDDKSTIQVKVGCEYIIIDVKLDDKRNAVVLAERQDAVAIKEGKPVQDIDALTIAIMKVTE